MTLSHKALKRVHSPIKSPRRSSVSTLRKKSFLKRLSNAGVQFGSASKANLKVVVRVRPENQKEINSNARSVVDLLDDHMLVFDPRPDEDDFFFRGAQQKHRDLNKRVHREQKFIFERIFNPDSTNEEVFNTTTKDIVNTVLDGYNCSVFAYGATGSGKTHTMIGNMESPGIAFLTAMELYKKIEELEDSTICEVAVSYLEVYNEMVHDLLNPGKPLNLHENGQHVQVTGLTLHKPKDAEDLLQLLARGNLNRSQHPTDANAESSRSHAVFQVFVRQHEKSSTSTKSSVSIAKLSMIDLAGSERGAATGFKGARFREGASINKSLLALGNCINALADGKGHIPYRDSKLTRLLKDSIGGNCRSVMIATITRSSLSFEDTFNTLRYANRAKTIKMTLKKNLVNIDQHVSQYVKVVEDLKAKLLLMEEKMKNHEEAEKAQQEWRHSEVTNEERRMYEETIQNLRQQLEEARGQKEEKEQMEETVMNEMNVLNSELKICQREILQLETSERELEMKIYGQRLQMVRMKIFAFASKKLEKGIAKSQRSVQTFQMQLAQIHNLKESHKEKLSNIKDSILRLFENRYKEGVVEERMPDSLVQELKHNELQQSVRDCSQIKKYLQEAMKDLLTEKTTDEKLILLLLVTVKHLFLSLKVLKQCDVETEEFLQKIFGMLDSSRIEWADLKNTEESFGEQIISQHVTLEPMIDTRKITEFSNLYSVVLSPIVYDMTKMYKSNIKRKQNVIEDSHPPEFSNGLQTNSLSNDTPIPARKLSPHHLNSVYSTEENGKVYSGSINEVQLDCPLSSPNLTKILTPNSHSSAADAMISSNLNIMSNSIYTPENPVYINNNELQNTKDTEAFNPTNDTTPVHQSTAVSNPTESQSVSPFNKTAPLRRNGSPFGHSYPKESDVQDLDSQFDMNRHSALNMNQTVTLVDNPSEEGGADVNAVVSYSPSHTPEYHPAEISPSDSPPASPHSPAANVTITLSQPNPIQIFGNEAAPLVSNNFAMNSTFSLGCEENSNSRVAVVAENVFKEPFPAATSAPLQPLPHVVNNNSQDDDEEEPAAKQNIRKLTLCSSKKSFSKLPSNPNKPAVKTFKRSQSVSFINDVATSKSKGLESSIKKVTSFARSMSGSALKNQENRPPRPVNTGVAFGASYVSNMKSKASKRALNFNTPTHHPRTPTRHEQ